MVGNVNIRQQRGKNLNTRQQRGKNLTKLEDINLYYDYAIQTTQYS